MDALRMTASFWGRKRVLVTGHTGFKGGWLALWLNRLGAEVHGFALAPVSEPNLFKVANVEGAIASSTIGDIRDEAAVVAAMRACDPDILFHLAAQPLVRASYLSPTITFATNVMGTVNVLEAARAATRLKAIVNVTTDKCYENREWIWPYRESEALGGRDPYSSSKACAELVSSAYRHSFFSGKSTTMLATARAGNVIGGGDWAEDRLLPDMLRAWDAGLPVRIRSPHSVRPWQHVLECLAGYLALAEALYSGNRKADDSWNFGPFEDDVQTVGAMASEFAARTGCSHEIDRAEHPHEATLLRLDSTKARNRLGWRPCWRAITALEKTIEWHLAWRRGEEMQAITTAQIAEYEQMSARKSG